MRTTERGGKAEQLFALCLNSPFVRLHVHRTHSGQKESPADLTVATFEFLKLRGGVPDPETKPEICQRNSPGVDQGPPRRRPGPTRRLLSALRGVLLPFAHGFRE